MRYLTLNKKGQVRTFKGDFPQLERELRDKREVRLSSVVPRHFVLRVLWKALRLCFEALGYSKGVEWLRSWKVEWVVIVEGKALGVFKDRGEAIRWEREYFTRRCLL